MKSSKENKIPYKLQHSENAFKRLKTKYFRQDDPSLFTMSHKAPYMGITQKKNSFEDKRKIQRLRFNYEDGAQNTFQIC